MKSTTDIVLLEAGIMEWQMDVSMYYRTLLQSTDQFYNLIIFCDISWWRMYRKLHIEWCFMDMEKLKVSIIYSNSVFLHFMGFIHATYLLLDNKRITPYANLLEALPVLILH